MIGRGLSALLVVAMLWPVAALGVTTSEIMEKLSDIETSPVRPYALFGLKVSNDVLTTIAIESGVPPVVLAGTVVKTVSVGVGYTTDVADHALELQDETWQGQMVLLGEDTKKLKALKQSGVSMGSPEAQALIREIEGNAAAIRQPGEGLLGYQATVLLKNAPYAAVLVARDKIVEKVIGVALESTGAAKYVNEKFHIYDGVHEKVAQPWTGFSKRIRSWAKLDDRATRVVAAASKALAEQEAAAVAKLLKASRPTDLDSAAGKALNSIYETVMINNPSDPREIRVERFRLAAAQAAKLAPPVPLPRPVPVVVAARPALVQMTAFPQDPQINAINADDGLVREYEREPRAVARQVDPPQRREEPGESAEFQAMRQRWRDELAKVGDGKTFAVCSNGCPGSTGTWDGERGKSLRDR